ncbi:hypothetical protein NE237_031440 [Protea cynaroides]|uniref:Methyltransferase type 11 domain-containing protein n=1 Tax=Protea cynaroides TaxID=273540 RepID=A0A9Q0L163_9MAGN|nr:hypothetical protein NE237_031440 [Protea cynaroides]
MSWLQYASSLDEANEILRGNWLQAIEQHHLQYYGGSMIKDILDVGCSVGGLDLPPYFLAVAQYKEKERNQGRIQSHGPIKISYTWVHANGENTGLPSKSFDTILLAFGPYECPRRAIIGLVLEAFCLLRPGGIIPKSKILHELSPVLFTLMKSTDLEETMRRIMSVNICTILTDPRHQTVLGTVVGFLSIQRNFISMNLIWNVKYI